MRKFRYLIMISFIFAFPQIAKGYVGVKLGVVDEEQFGYGLDVGAQLFWNFGLAVDLVGYYDKDVGVSNYWLQGNVDLTYDFHEVLEKLMEGTDFHPYLKGGFTYAGLLIDSPTVTDIKANHGPGFNIGAGLDWKVFGPMSIGIELTENFIFLDGVTVSGVKIADDTTAKVFNAMAVLKVFAY